MTHATALLAHRLTKLWADEHTEHTRSLVCAEWATLRTCLQVLCQIGGHLLGRLNFRRGTYAQSLSLL